MERQTDDETKEHTSGREHDYLVGWYFLIQDDLLKRMREAARQEGISAAEWTRRAVLQSLERVGQSKENNLSN